MRNSSTRSRVRTLEKRYLKSLESGDLTAAGEAFKQASSAIDKAAKVGVLHSGTASRKKSRLNRRLVAASAPKSAEA